MNNQELLAILDMSEDEQYEWVEENCETMGFESSSDKTWVMCDSLEEIAIRLRDEECKDNAGIINYKDALLKIYEIWDGKQAPRLRVIISFTAWIIAYKKPIDDIIAALIAKGETE